MEYPFLYSYPIELNALFFVLFLMGAVELSYRIGCWKRNKIGEEREIDRRGDIVLSAMLGILGLLFAFTYAFTTSRSDKRKTAILTELNALGTAFHRADLVEDPHRTHIRNALHEYTASLAVTRDQADSKENLRATIDRILAKQKPLWPLTKQMVTSISPGPLHNAVVAAVNDVHDASSMRRMASFDRLPTAILAMLLFVAGATLSVAGYSAGRANSLRRWRMTALTLILAAVMVVITDFDRPLSGSVQTDQQGYVDLANEMEESLAAP